MTTTDLSSQCVCSRTRNWSLIQSTTTRRDTKMDCNNGAIDRSAGQVSMRRSQTRSISDSTHSRTADESPVCNRRLLLRSLSSVSDSTSSRSCFDSSVTDIFVRRPAGIGFLRFLPLELTSEKPAVHQPLPPLCAVVSSSHKCRVSSSEICDVDGESAAAVPWHVHLVSLASRCTFCDWRLPPMLLIGSHLLHTVVNLTHCHSHTVRRDGHVQLVHHALHDIVAARVDLQLGLSVLARRLQVDDD